MVAVLVLALSAMLIPRFAGAQEETAESFVIVAEGATDSCVDIAVRRKLDNWVCIGPQLITSNGVDYLDVQPRESSKPPSEQQGFSATAPGDDYDLWCENGSTCTRPISSYISETKGNAAYGNSSGAIGQFDVILRTNLNGRQARWTVSLDHDGGPDLKFYLEVACFEDEGNFPDSDCGTHFAGNPYLAYNQRWTSNLIYGDRLNDSNEYYGRVQGVFTPTGYPQFTLGHLYSARFNCHGTDNCYFP